MPRGDGTGPQGKGPKTGRGLGNCTPTSPTIGRKPTIGRGMKNRRGNRNRRGTAK